MQDELDLGINPKSINETESRQFTLLLNLIKFKSGLNFSRIRSLMPAFYSNENLESDQKKLQRDIKELKDLGFSVKFYKVSYEGAEDNIYKLDQAISNKEIQFNEKELKYLSLVLLEAYESNPSEDLFTASQKIFYRDMKFFPEMEPDKHSSGENKNIEKKLQSILNALQNKIPLKIEYFKSNPDEKESREIEPLSLIKRNSSDFYLIAYDRQRRAKRRFLIPKILQVSEIPGEFENRVKVTEEDSNYHALNFNVHESEEIKLTVEEGESWKMEKFLFPHPYTKKGNEFSFKTTNRSAIFDFIWKENGIIQSVNSKTFLEDFKRHILKISKNYQDLKL